MTSLRIQVDDEDQGPAEGGTSPAGGPDTVSTMIQGMECGHCGGGMEELHAPLTCGCVICNCMCPCWHDCPKHAEEPDPPQTEMKKE